MVMKITCELITPPGFFLFQSAKDYLEDSDEYCEYEEEDKIEYDSEVKSQRILQFNKEMDLKSDAWEAYNRIKYGIKYRDWVVINDTYKKFLLENTSERGSTSHIWLLSKLDQFFHKVDTDSYFKVGMSARKFKAFNAMKETVIMDVKEYQCQITSFRKKSGTLGWFKSSDEDIEIQDEGENEEDLQYHWVTGEREIKWNATAQKLREIFYQRESRTSFSLEEVQHLTLLIRQATTPAQIVHTIFCVADAQFSLNKSLCGHIPVKLWKNCVENMSAVVHILESNRNIVVGHGFPQGGWREEVNETKKEACYKGNIMVGWELLSVISRLCFEFHASLRVCDPSSIKYAHRLQNGALLLDLCEDLIDYLSTKGDFGVVACIAVLLMGLVYFKTQEEYHLMGSNSRRCGGLMKEMFGLIELHGNEIIKAQAVVLMIYHHSIMDEFESGENLLLESYLHLMVQHMDLAFLAYYKKALVQLGLSGFRGGCIEQAHTHLCNHLYAAYSRETELSGGKKILNTDMLPYREDKEFVELVEVVHLICALLIDKKSLSKRCLMQLKVARKKGWKGFEFECIFTYLESWIHTKCRAYVRQMLKTKIKEDSSLTYGTFKLEELMRIFEDCDGKLQPKDHSQVSLVTIKN